MKQLGLTFNDDELHQFREAREGLSEQAAWQWSLSILDRLQMNKEGPSQALDDAFKDAIKCSSAHGDWERALVLLEEHKQAVNTQFPPDCLAPLIESCCRAEQWKATLALLSKLSPGKRTSAAVSDQYLLAFNAAAKLCQKKSLKHAIAVVDDMQGMSLQPDIDVWNAIVNSMEPGVAKETPLIVRESWKFPRGAVAEAILGREAEKLPVTEHVRGIPSAAKEEFIEQYKQYTGKGRGKGRRASFSPVGEFVKGRRRPTPP
eukprot:TRINITY_DN14594_c0_g1_i1.p1 TRINITY_DN14594_c0_g1~~TRINITY_DN14594_c0_g1_i1.p1  ORF type:complete len:261 (+),score=54.99 TRINITY_DN14594_c0_g1_i1:293-1075(+)